MRAPRAVRVALAGCGTVGSAFVRLLEQSRDELTRRSGSRYEVVRVLVRDRCRPRPVDSRRLTTDLAEFLTTEADVFVEAIGGIEPAFSIARATLARGRRFITANKALVAAHGHALTSLARREAWQGARLEFEAAVGGAIPLVRVLRDGLAGVELRRVQGVLNGTTNYVLTRLGDGLSLGSAIAEAQRRGFAEADPSRDLSGRDAADKIAILSWLAFGTPPNAAVRCTPTELDRAHAAARADGKVLRQVATAERAADGEVRLSVAFEALAPDHDLARLRGEDNLVLVESRSATLLRFGGPGAGGDATASALVADLMAMPRSAPRP